MLRILFADCSACVWLRVSPKEHELLMEPWNVWNPKISVQLFPQQTWVFVWLANSLQTLLFCACFPCCPFEQNILHGFPAVFCPFHGEQRKRKQLKCSTFFVRVWISLNPAKCSGLLCCSSGKWPHTLFPVQICPFCFVCSVWFGLVSRAHIWQICSGARRFKRRLIIMAYSSFSGKPGDRQGRVPALCSRFIFAAWMALFICGQSQNSFQQVIKPPLLRAENNPFSVQLLNSKQTGTVWFVCSRFSLYGLKVGSCYGKDLFIVEYVV